MDSFSVETTFTLADWQTYQATFARKLQDEENGMVLGPRRTLTFAIRGYTALSACARGFLD